VVGGQEHYFGGGINVVPAGTTLFGHPVQVISLGRTQLPSDLRESLLVDLAERYTPESYSLFDNNCNNFSDDLANLLVGRGVPDHITGLPAEVLTTPFGQMIRPMLSGLEAQLGGMRQQVLWPPTLSPAGVGQAADPASEAAVTSSPTPAVATEAAPALVAAAREIDAAVAEGMMHQLEGHIEELELKEGMSALSLEQQLGQGGRERMVVETAVKEEFDRLVAAGMDRHEAEAHALEIVAGRATRAATAAEDGPT
jgi:desumoylating isopeptidase 1